jgi:hypothetical protein
MGNQRTTFLKRQREMDRNDKTKAKEARLAAARSEQKTTKGPQIAWDEAVTEQDSALTSEKPPATTSGNLSSPNANSNNTAAPGTKPAPAPLAAKPAPGATKPAPAPVATKPAPVKPPVKP